MTFALNFIALTPSEVDQLQTSTVGWIFIAVAWSVIGALWLGASSLPAPSASQSSTETSKEARYDELQGVSQDSKEART